MRGVDEKVFMVGKWVCAENLLDLSGMTRLSGIQVEMLITIWVFVTGTERGLGTLRDTLGWGACAEGNIQEMSSATLQQPEVREMGRGGWGGAEREIRIQVGSLRSC